MLAAVTAPDRTLITSSTYIDVVFTDGNIEIPESDNSSQGTNVSVTIECYVQPATHTHILKDTMSICATPTYVSR